MVGALRVLDLHQQRLHDLGNDTLAEGGAGEDPDKTDREAMMQQLHGEAGAEESISYFENTQELLLGPQIASIQKGGQDLEFEDEPPLEMTEIDKQKEA